MKIVPIIQQVINNQDFINQMPGLFVVLDLMSYFLAANQAALKWTGYKSLDSMIGTTYFDMPCKAAEQHENFINQDKSILTSGGNGKIVGFYCYANNEWKIILAEKYALRNQESDIVALVSYITDLTNSRIIDVSKFISLTNDGRKKRFIKQQSGFLINNDLNQISLTTRQAECLFFLIRGKTSREISQILNISYRTVEVFADSLKDKFDCKTKSELIDKAICSGYMNCIPESLFNLVKSK